MVWAKCPTHGPIQDAGEVRYGGILDRVVCKCGLDCEAYEPEGFVEHADLVAEAPEAEEVEAPPKKKRAAPKKKEEPQADAEA